MKSSTPPRILGGKTFKKFKPFNRYAPSKPPLGFSPASRRRRTSLLGVFASLRETIFLSYFVSQREYRWAMAIRMIEMTEMTRPMAATRPRMPSRYRK